MKECPKKPETVKVIAKSTYATNNKTEAEFISNNWIYDKQTGSLTITVENEATDKIVAWNKNVKDEYLVTYIYNEKVQTINVEQKSKVSITTYNNVLAETENTLTIEQTENKGNFVTTEISSEDTLSKGYLYTQTDKEYIYNEIYTLSTFSLYFVGVTPYFFLNKSEK